MKLKHERVYYECDQCQCKATWHLPNGSYKVEHEGVRYECDQCEYKSTCNGNLSKHKK